MRARTRWSVAYVACATIGTALGPILAGVLLLLPEYTMFGWSINKLNSPALVMSVVWVIYFICLIGWFRDPNLQRDPPEKSTGSNLTFYNLTPTLIVLWTLFYCKVIQEIILTSGPMLSGYYFNWSGTYTGFYLAMLNVLVIPVHMLVG
jgi:MFS family permease